MRALAVLLLVLLGPLAPAAQAAECHDGQFENTRFSWCIVDLQAEELRVFLRDADGIPYGGFNRLDSALKARGQRLGVAMNGGMYHDDRAPVGLYIEDGQQEMRVITSDGPGNFGLLPNGVLCIQDHRAQVIESRRYAETQPACLHATQSGPMLVIDGKLHPRFLEDGTSRYIRNGVGIRKDGREAVLAISDQPVNFHRFARFFRDAMETPNALFLDGNVSRLYAPALGRSDPGFPMGPILGTVEPAE